MPQVAIDPAQTDYSDEESRGKKIKDIIKRKSTKELKPGKNTISRKLAAFWKEQINAVGEANARWVKRGGTVIKRYRDERTRVDEDQNRKMNLLWTNIAIMKPAIYNRCPIPNVDRKFADKDPTALLSAQMMERSLRNELESNRFHSAISRAVKDYLLPGRGQVWVRYEPEIGESVSIPSAMETTIADDLNKIENDGEIVADENPEDEKLENTGEQLVTERVPVDYVDWQDFGVIPAKARTEDEIQAKYKKVHMSKEECIERFGKEIGSQMRPDTLPISTRNDRAFYSDTSIFQDINERSIIVYEIWNKTDRRVYWICTGYDYLADVQNDPLKLKGFFPCPPMLQATTTNDTVIPVPDYWEWQDQAIQIDELTQRIAMLTKACKIAGTYDASNGALKRLMNESTENQLIPVDQWAVHAEKGGVKGSISFLPLEEIQSCIATLQEVRQQCKQDLDEVTGLSDVLRGTTDSRETLGGLRIKNNNAGSRLDEKQEEVAEFARATIRIVAEIIAKHFTDDGLIKTSGILYDESLQPETILAELTNKMAPPQQGPQAQQPQGQPSPQQGAAPQPQQSNVVPFSQAQQSGAGGPPMPQQPAPQMQPFPDLSVLVQPIIAQKVQKSIDLIRNEIEFGYRIDIETDSTVFGDEAQERQDATEFVEMVTKFIAEAGQVGAQDPSFIPLAGQMLEFVIRKFKAGRDLESAINAFVDKAAKKAKAAENAPPQPSPEQIKAKAEIDKIQAQGALQAQNDQRDAAKQQAEDQRQAEIQKQEDLREMMKARMEDERAQKMAELEATYKKREFAMKMHELELGYQFREKEHKLKMEELDKKATENNAKRAERKQKAKSAK